MQWPLDVDSYAEDPEDRLLADFLEGLCAVVEGCAEDEEEEYVRRQLYLVGLVLDSRMCLTLSSSTSNSSTYNLRPSLPSPPSGGEMSHTIPTID